MLIIGKKLSPYALLSISGLLAASDQAAAAKTECNT